MKRVCILLLLAVQVRESPARRKRQQHDHRIETDQYGDHYQSVDQDHSSQQYAHPFPNSEDTTENSENPFYHSGNEFTDSENRFYESRNEQSRSKTRLDIQHTQPDNQFTKDESNPAQGRNNRHQNQPHRKQRRPHDSRYLNSPGTEVHDTHSSEDYLDTEQEQSDANQQRRMQRRERQRLLEEQQDQMKKQIRHKLLIIVLDGFRWDYMEQYERRTGLTLDGFRAFQSGGVRSEYLESVFPAESFPAWQTLQTGLYPENHDIVGNQFYDSEIHKQLGNSGQAFFNIEDQRSTQHMKWWQKDEPLWATAKKHDVTFAAYLWGRCDIPYDAEKRLRFDFCENLYQKDGTKTLRINVDKALMNFQSEFDAAIIYEDSLERAAEDYGPNSSQLEDKVKELDLAISHLSDRLNVTNMADIVNVVILSDHGMSQAAPPRRTDLTESGEEMEIRKIQLSDTLSRENVRWVVGSGSHAAVYPRGKEFRQQIIEELSNIQGIQVFDHPDIPERFHYKLSKNTPPILVLASPGTVILSSTSDVQRPSYLDRNGGYNPQRLIEQTKMGVAGYDPEEPDMRGIFMARGPAFKDTGEVLPPVQLVDVYELLCKVLDIEPRPNDGIFARIQAFLKGGATDYQCSNFLLLLLLPALLQTL
ncbi:ectonucleotide pyrophosphatase/phosphodiesterase family member 6 isoform X2 [Eurytemora carolleeae]|uniref:ectonucleotide pyrophosphatase/phosphodiesterase family member 6 isoform X2 n=1 Tax=Eurytemora carolleeae TaxID=1294199 RepID=UPI000C77A263|nr:ectonucleotide pyrophosphatase/phosphodiesterase family member 6 isoform X2 [Eurytemora carolleeae]|eukprot:XP_023340595.1 ectonucleotide pyrophosphatase/phosphodiesterase family member 6-like isoform X2 [Eurytemora affinis]